MKRKGFTLIELLAVIVILVVIMAVTIPVILNVIETSRREAFKDSVLSAFNEVEYYVLENKLGDVPAEGIEVKNLNLNKNPFQYGIIIKNEDGNLSAEEVSDGEYCAVGTINNLSITKGECDTASPTGEVTVEGKKATITLRDDQGVMGYEITKSEEVSSWTTIEVTKEIVVEYEASESGTYYVHIKDKFGKTSRISFVIENSAFCAYQPGDIVRTFEFSGDVEEFVVPCSGTYKLEVWGAQGGTIKSYASSKGGYSYGNIALEKGTPLFIAVGGRGQNSTIQTGVPKQEQLAGGFNGGGSAWASQPSSATTSGIAGGGGATHIATGEINRGVLSNYASYKEEVLIVAGGAGGTWLYLGWPAPNYTYTETYHAGGTGGGTSGGNANNSTSVITGGSQTTGAAFGQGVNFAGYNGSGGGGGGYYGGKSTQNEGAGGGSGYLNADRLIDGTTGMSNGQRSGDGKAVITLVSIFD